MNGTVTEKSRTWQWIQRTVLVLNLLVIVSGFLAYLGGASGLVDRMIRNTDTIESLSGRVGNTPTLEKWESRSVAVRYQAAGDGFLVAFSGGMDRGVGRFGLYTGAPGFSLELRNQNVRYGGAVIPVKGGDSYEIRPICGEPRRITAYWIPFGPELGSNNSPPLTPEYPPMRPCQG